MTKPVITLDPLELAPQLEELSWLASHIAQRSDELRVALRSSADTASACASLLHDALLNARSCLSFLQSIPQAPIHPPGSPPAPGGHSANESSPLSHQSSIRRRVSLSELVDEEDSSPGTRGGVNHPFRRPVTRASDMSRAQNYPPLCISIIDVTPRYPRGTEGADILSNALLRSPSRPCRRHTAGEGRSRPQQKAVLPAASEVPGRRVTRSHTKRLAAKESGMENKPSKRARASSPY